MKKLYIGPQMSIVTIKLAVDALIHSPFERGGKNEYWDWNDDQDEYLDPGLWG